MMSKTVSIKTLGCKLNQYESSRIEQQFLERGWKVLPFGESADIVIVNTCTVTDRSDKKCRNYIRQGARFSNSKRVIVTGCLADAENAALVTMPEVDHVLGNAEKDSLFLRLEERYRDSEFGTLMKAVSDNAAGAHKKSKRQSFRTRGYIKIQDGCDGICSYCIVPAVRGKPRSRRPGEILDQAQQLIDAGCPEIVLTGITIGKYLYDRMRLTDIISRLLQLEGTFRIRVTSIEPNHVTDELVSLYENPRLCRHIHLPLQSGSDKILKLMQRTYSVSQYAAVVEKLRSRVPGIAIGSDIIIGYPGESEDDFRMSVAMVAECNFASVHQFKFSPRKGTMAAALTRDISSDAIQERSVRMRENSGITGLEYRKQFEGSTLMSVIERKSGGSGFTSLTDNYIKMDLDGSAIDVRAGSIVPVKLVSAGLKRNCGKIVE